MFYCQKRKNILKRIGRTGELLQADTESRFYGGKVKKSASYRKGVIFKFSTWLLKNGVSIDAWTFSVLILICISVFFLISIFIKNGIFFFILISIIFIFLIFILIDFKGRKISYKKENQLESFLLDLMSNLYANPNILTGIQKTLETSENPLKREFEFFIDDIRRGMLFNEALKNMLARNRSKIFEIVITGFSAANEKGADIVEFLKDQIDYIREKKSITNYIKILSTGPRYTSYIIMFIPITALTVSTLINKSLLNILTSGAGLAVLIYSIISYLVGFFIINRIIGSIES